MDSIRITKITRAAILVLPVWLLSIGCATVSRPHMEAAALPPPETLSDPLRMEETIAAALRQDGQLHVMRAAIPEDDWEKIHVARDYSAFETATEPTDYLLVLSAHLGAWTHAESDRIDRPPLAQSPGELLVLAALDRENVVARDVRLAFAEAVGCARLEALYRERLDLLEELEDITRQERERGNRTQLDVIEVTQALRAARGQPADALFSRQQAMDRLRRCIGLPAGAPLALAAAPEDLSQWDLGVDGDDMRLGPASRAELTVAAARAMREGEMLAWAEVSWRLDGEMGPVLVGLEDGPPREGAMATIEILAPARDAGADSGEPDARAEALGALQAQAILDIHHAVKEYHWARERVHAVLPEQVERAESASSIIQNMREAGVAREADVLRAREQLVSARIALERARLDLWRSHAKLAAALGRAANPGVESE